MKLLLWKFAPQAAQVAVVMVCFGLAMLAFHVDFLTLLIMIILAGIVAGFIAMLWNSLVKFWGLGKP